MKTHARIQQFLTAASVAALLATQAPKSFADDKEKPSAKEQAAAMAAMHGYDLVIAGGVLIEPDGHHYAPELTAVIEALRRQFPEANIVLAPELGQTILSDLKLHARELPEMLEAIRVASGEKFDWFAPGAKQPNSLSAPRGTIDPATGLPQPESAPDPNSGLYILRPPAQSGQNERVVEAFNISSYIESKLQEARAANDRKDKPFGASDRHDIEEETVMQLKDLIVQTVANFKQTGENDARHDLKFEFHRGASLLVVIGPRSDVEIVRKLMGALTTEPDGMRVRPPSPYVGSFVPPTPPAPPEPVSVEAIPIKSGKMESAYTVAMSLLTDKRSKVVISDDRTKTLIVSGTKAEVGAIRKALDELEKASKLANDSKPYVGDKPVVDDKP
jgi:hypothetical protein